MYIEIVNNTGTLLFKLQTVKYVGRRGHDEAFVGSAKEQQLSQRVFNTPNWQWNQTSVNNFSMYSILN